MADGLFYLDTREPHIVSDLAAVTLAATAKALYPAASFPVLGSQYFSRPGKAMKIEMLLKLATGATPGNVSFNVHWGSGADATGTLICGVGTPVAWVANLTKLCKVEFWLRCLTTGTAGTLEGIGLATFDQNHVVAPNTIQYFPQAGGAASGSLDLTQAFIPSIQMLRSGSTAEAAQVQELKVVVFN